VKNRSIKILSYLAFAFSAVIVCSATPTSDLGEGLLGENPVIIRGGLMPSLKAAPISSLILAAVHDGKLQAIPFQVDQVRNGEYVYDWVSPSGRKKGLVDRDQIDGRLGEDDELVFMARDLGPRASSVKETGAEKAIEVAVTDPAAGRTGYAYFLQGSRLDHSTAAYVHLEVSKGRAAVEAERYKFSQLDNMGYFDNLQLKTRSGEWTRNLVVRNQTPADLKVKVVGLKGTVDFYDMIRGEVIAGKNGPVRAIWRGAGEADFGPFRIKGEGGSVHRFYANRYDQTLILDIPFNFGSVLSLFNIRGTLIFSPASLPLYYYDVSNRQGLKIDGSPKAQAGPLLGKETRDWCVFSPKGASLFFFVDFPADWRPKLSRVTYVDDGPKKSEAGSLFGDMVDLLTKGRHAYTARYYIMSDDFRWGMEKSFEDMSGQKMKVSCAAMP
jgi:hypothetical protein